jgi:SAM-dependent methyltransferase
MSERPFAPDPTILETVARYYSEKLRTFGPTPEGVDWNSVASQTLRFTRLLCVLDETREGSLIDYGCGYGALLDYLQTTGLQLSYRGFDISEAMVASATARRADDPSCSFTADPRCLSPADYTVASGIFNVKLDHPADAWREYVLGTIAILDSLSIRGFAFNMLSTYSDADRQREDLFYADPLSMFDLCKRRFSPRVSLLHDYGLYEFTIIVRK